MRPLAAITAYIAHPDPRTAACSRIALVVAWNQPLYPFYVAWLVGGDAWAACWTFLSTPFFIAVPRIARRNGIAGRALLVLTGTANTMVSAKAFGVASGVELFVLPCALIALLAFRRAFSWMKIGMLGVTVLPLLLHGFYGPALGRFSPADYARFFHLNAWSVVTLCLFVVWQLGSAIRSGARTAT